MLLDSGGRHCALISTFLLGEDEKKPHCVGLLFSMLGGAVAVEHPFESRMDAGLATCITTIMPPNMLPKKFFSSFVPWPATPLREPLLDAVVHCDYC